MNTYENEGTAISKQYGIKDADESKDQAVLLGVASTIMPELLYKYPDFLSVDSTSHHNGLNFSNTAFMVRSNELFYSITFKYFFWYLRNVYRCAGNATSTRQIDQRLPLILVINVTGISIEYIFRTRTYPKKSVFPMRTTLQQKGRR